MKTALPKRHYGLQVAVIIAVLGGVTALGQWYQQRQERTTKDRYTEVVGREYGESIKQQIASIPYSLRDLYDRAESVAAAQEDSDPTIWQLEAEINAARQARLVEVVQKAQASGNPSAFLETNIRNNQTRLAEILADNNGIPAKHRAEYYEIINELSIFRRAQVEVNFSRIPAPIVPNPQRLLN